MGSHETATAPYELTSEGNTLSLAGELRMDDASAIWRELRRAVDDASGDVVIDLSKVEAADGGIIALLIELREDLRPRGRKVELSHPREGVDAVLQLYECRDARRTRKRQPESAVAHVGRATVEVKNAAKDIFDFIGSLVLAVDAIVRRPRVGNWKEVFSLIERTGADAVPIVLLINFLVGFDMALQSSRQLKLYGANIYVADIVGVALTRELGPLMTAIVVLGRSGAAFAAEIGTMKVGEEIDALRTLGLTPYGWLVVPRILALVVVMPLLTLFADFIGIAGGAVIGYTELDVSFYGYFNETVGYVKGWDVVTGLAKSVAFALAISMISCQQGFAASGGAEGVGKRTTSAVVITLFAIIIIDAFLTVLFRGLGS